MRRQLATEVLVQAAPERVWQVLTDLGSYAEWNPFIVDATGTVRPGSRLRLRMQPVGGRATTLRPRVVEVDAGRRLRWAGRLGVPGLLDAVHTFTVEPAADGTTRVRQEEVFTGVLVPFVGRALDRGTLPAFRRMDEALRQRAERRTATPA